MTFLSGLGACIGYALLYYIYSSIATRRHHQGKDYFDVLTHSAVLLVPALRNDQSRKRFNFEEKLL